MTELLNPKYVPLDSELVHMYKFAGFIDAADFYDTHLYVKKADCVDGEEHVDHIGDTIAERSKINELR